MSIGGKGRMSEMRETPRVRGRMWQSIGYCECGRKIRMVHRQGITNVEIIKGREKIPLHGKIKLVYLFLRLDNIGS